MMVYVPKVPSEGKAVDTPLSNTHPLYEQPFLSLVVSIYLTVHIYMIQLAP